MSGHGHIQTYYSDITGVTEENHEKLQPGWCYRYNQRLESGISWIPLRSVTAWANFLSEALVFHVSIFVLVHMIWRNKKRDSELNYKCSSNMICSLHLCTNSKILIVSGSFFWAYVLQSRSFLCWIQNLAEVHITVCTLLYCPLAIFFVYSCVLLYDLRMCLMFHNNEH